MYCNPSLLFGIFLLRKKPHVISNDRYHYKTWFWIPITKVVKTGLIFRPKGKNKNCYSVPISEFVQVSGDDSLERVFAKFLRFY